MLLIDGKHPQRSRQSRPTGGSRVPGLPHERSLLVWDGVSGRSAAQSLYGRRSGGYAGNISSLGYRSLSLLVVALVSVLVAAQEPSFGR
jgi:hypothetical protein